MGSYSAYLEGSQAETAMEEAVDNEDSTAASGDSERSLLADLLECSRLCRAYNSCRELDPIPISQSEAEQIQTQILFRALPIRRAE